MTGFTIQVQDQQVRAALDALADRVAHARPLLQDLGVCAAEPGSS